MMHALINGYYIGLSASMMYQEGDFDAIQRNGNEVMATQVYWVFAEPTEPN